MRSVKYRASFGSIVELLLMMVRPQQVHSLGQKLRYFKDLPCISRFQPQLEICVERDCVARECRGSG